ncbi:hypothetical protein QUA42_19895 [Microcoleus sp. Pol11C2]|uniref:hypothetical protein n=1 Tax=Microcoleus sp. Pol11C2 TaxID=3055389 RepID=UPI002FD13432
MRTVSPRLGGCCFEFFVETLHEDVQLNIANSLFPVYFAAIERSHLARQDDRRLRVCRLFI